MITRYAWIYRNKSITSDSYLTTQSPVSKFKNIVNDVPQLMGLSSYSSGMKRKKASFVYFLRRK